MVSNTLDITTWTDYKGLIRKGYTLNKNSTVKDASFIPSSMAVVLDEDSKVIGTVSLSDIYRHAMNGCSCKSPIEPFIEEAITHKASEGFESLLNRYLSKNNSFDKSEIVVITYHDGSYIGVIEVADIVDFIEKKKYQEALFSNPLTGLPGKPMIEEILKKRPGEDIALVDLSDFKAYNDKYGPGKGDEVIKFTATLLLRGFNSEGAVCHIGGDDFFCIHPCIENVVPGICERFDREILDFYDPDDARNGCIVSKNRQGELTTFPIMTISFSISKGKSRKTENYILITQSLMEVKRLAKAEARKAGRSIFLFDKRSLEEFNMEDET